MKKKVFIIHGWGFNSTSYWIPKIKEELEKLQYDVITIDMPDTETPIIDNWVKVLEKVTKNKSNKNTYFIAHSIGCQSILRLIEKSQSKEKIGGILFVAGWITLKGLTKEEKSIAEPWINTPVNFKKVNRLISRLVCIFSTDDPYVSRKNIEFFDKKLNANIIKINKRGHIDKKNDYKIILDIFNKFFKK